MRKAMIAVLLMIPILPIFASTIERTQTVFTIMDWTGKPKETSVVNWIRVEGAGKSTIKDKPELGNLTILESKKDPTGKDELVWEIDGNADIYYTGKTNKVLPVSVLVKLTKDGLPVEPANVAGRGELGVEMTFTNHLSSREILAWESAGERKTSEKNVFYPMTVMIQLSLDVSEFREIKGDASMPITVGGTSRYIWTAFPKPKTTVRFSIVSDNLKLPPLQISIMPKAPEIPLPEFDKDAIDVLGSLGSNPELFDMLGMDFGFDVESASKNIDQLTFLLDGVSTAVSEADKGLGCLAILLENYAANLKTIQSGVSGLKQLSEGHKQVIDMMKTQFDSNMDGIDESLGLLKSASDQSSSASREVFKVKAGLEDMEDLLRQVRFQITDTATLAKLDEIESLRKSAYSKIDIIKADSDKAAGSLKTLLEGGTANGKQIPSLGTLPEQMKLLGDTLTALSTGGKIMGNDLPGLSTTIDGLKGINDGLGLIVGGGKIQDQSVPPFSDLPKQLKTAISGLKMLVDGGVFNGQTVPSQVEMKKMIGEFKEQLDSMPDMNEFGKTMESLKSTIDEAGGPAKLKESMDETTKLVYESQAEYNKMKELGDKYDSFIGKTDNAKGSVIFIIKFADISSNITNSNHIDAYDSNKSMLENDVGKYKYILLIVAIAIIILSFPINWLYKKRYSVKR